MATKTSIVAARLLDLRGLHRKPNEPTCHAKCPVLNYNPNPNFSRQLVCTRPKDHEGFHVAHLANGDLCPMPPWDEKGLLWEKEE